MRGKSCRLHSSHVHSTRRYLIDKSRCFALNTLQEDHAHLPDKYNTLSHTTSQKLAARAAELTARERHVESLAAELYDAHEAAVSHSVEVLRLQSALDAHEAEGASWSVLRAELTRQAERTHHLEAARAQLSALTPRGYRRRITPSSAARLLRMSCAHFEAEVEATRAEGEAQCVSPFIRFRISGANLIGAFKKRGT